MPKASYDTPRLTTDLFELQQLKTVKLLSKAFASLGLENVARPVPNNQQHTEKVVAKIFSELRQASQAKQRLAVLVYLPTLADYKETRTVRWRRYVQAEANRNDYFFVDIVEAMRTLPPHKGKELFRKGGHYTAKGNRYVAEFIYEKLSESRVLTDKFHQ